MPMAPAQVKSIRSLARGLQLLRHLQEMRGVTLHDLHLQLQLPKATLLRLLRTLEENGYAWRGLNDGRYRAGQRMKLIGDRPGSLDRLAEVAGPILDELVAAVQWPSDLSIRHGTSMELCETSRPRSHFLMNRLSIGFRINMVLSAPGRAYLAFCPRKERAAILSQLRRKSDPGYMRLGGDACIERMLDETQARGYSIRDSDWGGHLSEPKAKYDDGLAAIAVPILVAKRVVGCINIVWIVRVATVETIVKRHLAALQNAAGSISAEYKSARLKGT